MMAATVPLRSGWPHRLLSVTSCGGISHGIRQDFLDLLRPGDLLVANDAATLPASLSGVHTPSGRIIEVRLAGRASLDHEDIRRFSAIVFGEGDFRTRTEDRPVPPLLAAGDVLRLGSLHAIVEDLLGHPRFISLRFEGAPRQIWEGLVRHGRPIQYAHLTEPLAVWDTWTAIAAPPVAFEPPSAGFIIDWSLLASLPAKGIRFYTITHAAGISSTGDPALDARLPLDEPYRISRATARAIAEARARGSRVIAIGTTVVRALEHAACRSGVVRPGDSLATQKVGPATPLRVVDAVLSGVHEPGTSHHELLRAFVDDATLGRIDEELESGHYRTHEFGDSVFLEASRRLRLFAAVPAPGTLRQAAPQWSAHGSTTSSC